MISPNFFCCCCLSSHGENSAGVIAAVANEKCGIGLAYNANAEVGGKVTSQRLCYYCHLLDYMNSVILTAGRSHVTYKVWQRSKSLERYLPWST